MTDSELFASFLKKYKITNYNIIADTSKIGQITDRKVIFDIDNNYYYKIINYNEKGLEEDRYNLFLDIHYFLNNAQFPNHLISSTNDVELGIWITKQSPAPGLILGNILKTKENKLDKNFIIKFLEWFKWLHTESRRVFPEKTDKYFMPTDTHTHFDTRVDTNQFNIIYDVNTNQFTYIDFEAFASWGHWYEKDRYFSSVFEGIIYLLDFIRQTKHNNMYGFLSNREYPELLNYCFRYIDKEII